VEDPAAQHAVGEWAKCCTFNSGATLRGRDVGCCLLASKTSVFVDNSCSWLGVIQFSPSFKFKI